MSDTAARLGAAKSASTLLAPFIPGVVRVGQSVDQDVRVEEAHRRGADRAAGGSPA
ncbi:MAG: hypothetical protein JWO38_2827 [Gemmataceae bacterium]|nr:hypothetical protein [Gemmataceae bacterium]